MITNGGASRRLLTAVTATILATAATVTTAVTATVVAAAAVDASDEVVVTVDHTTATTPRPPLGVTVTGYGNQAYITNDATHRGHLRRLAPALMRIELGYATPGDPTSRVVCGASFCDTAVDGAAWIGAIRDLGAEPMVILPLDGRHAAGVDVTDAVNLYRFLATTPGGPVRRFVVGNETNNSDGNPHAMAAAEYSRRFNLVTDALRAENPDVVMAGPATSSYRDAIGYLDTFLATSGGRVDVVDIHKYGQGGATTHTDDELLGAVVDSYTTELADLRRRIDTAVPARAGAIGIQVGEYHLDWDGDPRTLTGFTTVWAAAVTGAILTAGAVPVQYGDKNGQLGLTSENGEGPYVRNEPLPIYHGLSMFTTIGPFGTRQARTTSSATPTRVDLRGFPVGSATVWQTTGAAAQQVSGHTVGPHAVTLTLPARSVSTVVLTRAAGPHRIRMEFYENGFDAVAQLSWTPPGGTRHIVPAIAPHTVGSVSSCLPSEALVKNSTNP